MNVSRPWLTLGVVPTLLLGLIVLPFVLYWGELPNPMAIHWNFAGDPDGSMPPLVMLLTVAGIFAAVHLAVTRIVARAPYETPSSIAVLYAVAAVLGGVAWLPVLASRNQISWNDADSVGLIQITMLVVAAGAAGSAGWFLAGGRSAGTSGIATTSPLLDVAEPGHTIWSGRGTGKPFYAVGAAVMVAGLVTWGWSTLALIVVGLVILTFTEVRVTVSRRGVVVSLGWMGFPSWTVPLRAISEAHVETVSPMAYGGWGYRIRPGVRAVVIRGGEALRLVREDKADLVLTVDDAETGAGLVNAILGVDSI